MWVEPDVRDEIVGYTRMVVSRSALSLRKVIGFLGIHPSRFYDWVGRQGIVNRHNGKIPREHWILDKERKAIIEYCRYKVLLGYRRLTYMMIDEDVAYVCPATTYRVLKVNVRRSLRPWTFPQLSTMLQAWQWIERKKRLYRFSRKKMPSFSWKTTF